MTILSSAEIQDLLRDAYPDAEKCDAFYGADDADILALIACAPTFADALCWWTAETPWWPPLQAAAKRWAEYCTTVETNLNKESNITAVFRVCPRCSSRRVVVFTRQMRSADEGMTEIRLCRECGHTTRINA